jgi:hypothetical protein
MDLAKYNLQSRGLSSTQHVANNNGAHLGSRETKDSEYKGVTNLWLVFG